VTGDVLQGIVDQLGECHEPSVPERRQLLPFPIVSLPFLVQLDGGLIRPGLLAVLFAVDVIVNPPDLRPWRTLE
jgi:hypothetical protein